MKTKKLGLRPFLSTNAIIILAVALMCVGQVITMVGICMRLAVPSAKEEFQLVWRFRDIINVAVPLYLVSLITDLLRDRSKIIKSVFMYLALALIFYLIEIIVFYTVAVPFINGIVSYYLEKNETGQEMVTSIIKLTSTYAISYFSNMNVFLDLFIVSLFAFFMFYTSKKENKKLVIFIRCLCVIPVLYFIASFILFGLFKSGYFTLSVEQASFLLHRDYLCFIFFFFIIIYQKYREKLYYKYRKNKEVSFEDYKKSTKGLYLYNLLLIGTLLTLILIDFLLGFIPKAINYGVGDSYVLLFSLPVLIFFNSERRVHVKTSYVLKFGLYVALEIILVFGYIAIFGHALTHIDNFLGFLRQ